MERSYVQPARIAVSEDGTISYQSAAIRLIKENSDGTITGLDDSSLEIIEKYDLNSDLEVQFRIFDKQLIKHQGPSKATNKSAVEHLRLSLRELGILNRNAHSISSRLENSVRTMIYASTITAFETFFSDYVLNSVQENPATLQNLAENYTDFKNTKYSLKDLITNNRDPKSLATMKLHELSFHNLNTINSVYSAAYAIKVPPFGKLTQAIEIRHDIVHRNGYRIGEANPICFKKNDLLRLFIEIQQFIIATLTEIEASQGN